MARPRNLIPAYRKHTQTGRAAVSIYRQDGSRTEVILPGKYGSKESKQEYERLLAQLRASGGQMPEKDCKAPDLTISELIARFMEERVATYYVNPATKQVTGEQENFASAMRPLNRLFGRLPVAEFGPQCLIAVQQAMIEGTWMTDAERDDWTKKGRKIGMARRHHQRACGPHQNDVQVGDENADHPAQHLPRLACRRWFGPWAIRST